MSTVDQDMTKISWTATPLGHKLIVYRGSEPIRNSSGILQASIVAIVDDTIGEVSDYPIPGIDYWYAVIDEVEIKSGKIILESGKNSTVLPVRIEAGSYRIGLPSVSPQSRSMPLPYLTGTATGATGGRQVPSIQLPREASLSSETEKAIDRLLEDIPAFSLPRPSLVILPEDRTQADTGEAYTLSIIIHESLEQGKWETAVEQLEKFLSIHRSADTELRARFYLGQAYARSGKYREALFSLLLVQDGRPEEVAPWRDWSLRQLRAEGQR